MIDGNETDLNNIDEKAIVKKKNEVKFFPLQNFFRNSKFSFLSTLLTGTDSCLESINLWMHGTGKK